VKKRTKVNHVGLVVQRGDFKTAIGAEALSKGVHHTLWSQWPTQWELIETNTYLFYLYCLV